MTADITFPALWLLPFVLLLCIGWSYLLWRVLNALINRRLPEHGGDLLNSSIPEPSPPSRLDSGEAP